MNEDEIDDVVCDILRYDGPDRHIDGHEVITEFIVAVLNGKGREWADNYRTGK